MLQITAGKRHGNFSLLLAASQHEISPKDLKEESIITLVCTTFSHFSWIFNKATPFKVLLRSEEHTRCLLPGGTNICIVKVSAVYVLIVYCVCARTGNLTGEIYLEGREACLTTHWLIWILTSIGTLYPCCKVIGFCPSSWSIKKKKKKSPKIEGLKTWNIYSFTSLCWWYEKNSTLTSPIYIIHFIWIYLHLTFGEMMNTKHQTIINTKG